MTRRWFRKGCLVGGALLLGALVLSGCSSSGGDLGGGGAQRSPPLDMTSVEPQTGAPGTAITVQGTGLTRATRVYWGEVELSASFQSSEQLLFSLPSTDAAGDVSNTLTLRREDDAQKAWPTPITVEAVPVPTGIQPSTAREGQLVRVSGTRLQLVKQLRMGDIQGAPTAVASDGSWLDFLVPAHAPSGSVLLTDAKGRVVPAGNLVVSGTAVLLGIEDVQISQAQLISISKAEQNPFLRLVAGRDTLVRVRLTPNSTSDVYAPEVRLTVRNDALGTNTFSMQGPAALSASMVAENDLANSYTYELPGKWMGPGFRLDVAVNEQKFPQSISAFSYTPSAGVLRGGTYIRLHVVPIAPDSGEKVITDFDWLAANLRAVYPLSEVDVVVEPPLKGPWGNGDSYGWIGAVRALRNASNPKNYDFYLGIMPCDVCGSLGEMPGRVAVSAHTQYQVPDWGIQGVAMHEIGHNFGRPHTWNDSYPHPGEHVGGPWAALINSTGKREFVDPTRYFDVMSYADPRTVSDFTYCWAYEYLQHNLPLSAKPTQAMLTKTAAQSIGAGEVLYIAGTLDQASGQAKLHAPVRMKGTADTVALASSAPPNGGDYFFEIATAQGRLLYPLQPQELSHAEPSARVFELTIRAVDGIETMRVLRGLTAQSTQTAAQAPKPAVLRASSVPQGAVVKEWGTYRVSDGTLALTWDATRWPWLSIWQRTANGLQPLTVAATGGAQSVSLRAPWSETRGLVVSLSDGLNSTLYSIDL